MRNRLQGDGEEMFSTVDPASKKTVHRLLSFDFQYYGFDAGEKID